MCGKEFQTVCSLFPQINSYCMPLPGAGDPEMNQPQLYLPGSKQPIEESSLSLFRLGPGAVSGMCAGQGEEVGTHSQW